MNGIPSPTLRRVAAAVSARRYAIGGVCLLIAAVALRFYYLSEHALRYDEAAAALNSRHALSQVVDYTRQGNSSPILYPLALWAVQRVELSHLSAWPTLAAVSVRLMPAVASALTVAALLFLMPRLGVPRRAAFLAALLAALSVAAIEHAQDAREYSIDALAALLMIAGALQYLRNGGKALLCAALFVAPLLQYGLVLFGVAVIGVAIVAATPPRSCVRKKGLAYHRQIWEWLKGRIDLLLPMSAFGVACAASWALTLRYQWKAGGWGSSDFLADYYYKSGFDAAAIAEFAITGTWDLLSYHIPTVIAAAALLALGALLPSLLKRRRRDALALLALFAIGVSLCAALMSLYPFGGIRQCLYLGPIVFLAGGSAFNSFADYTAAVARRAWLAPAFTAAIALGITLAGATAIRQDAPYTTYLQKWDVGMKQILAALEEREQEGDAVYVYHYEIPAMEFYKKEKPANYFYGKTLCWGVSYSAAPGAECAHEALDEIFRVFNTSRRIWLIHNKSSLPEEVAAHSQEVIVEEAAAYGWTELHLITNFDELAANIRKKWFDMHEDVASEAPKVVSTYNLYLRGNALHYAKQPCAPADTEARFFLHIYPADVAALPAHSQQRAFDNLDFDFHDYGLLAENKCLIRRALPDYAINRIHTGQFIHPSEPVAWEAGLPFNP